MIVEVPTEIPDTMPDDEPILATAGVLLDQIPPDVASVSVTTVPVHRLAGPDMAATTGTGFTEITLAAVALPQMPLTE